jgi:hypothetical protein
MMIVSIDRNASRAFEVRSKYSDSGVVIRMSAGSRLKRARSVCGVSPVRTAIAGNTYVSPRFCAAWPIPARGARRFRSTSTASAFSGEMYSARQRFAFGGSGANISRSRHQRNALSVLPLPVGARISVDSPRAMAGQPRACGRVGSPNVSANHARTAG